jgi:hypothetical protein
MVEYVVEEPTACAAHVPVLRINVSGVVKDNQPFVLCF